MTITRRLPMVAAAIALGALPLAAQQQAQQAAPDAAKIAAMAGTRGALVADLAEIESKYLKLLDAMKGKLDYRPGAGVRSAAEVFAHVAAGNYFVPTQFGVKPPAGVDMEALSKETDPDRLAANLKASFEHVRAALASLPESDLDKPTKLFGQDATIRRAQITVLTHMHEHLGQSIAYARASGVVPPWSGGD